MVFVIPKDDQDWSVLATSPKVIRGQPALPSDRSGFREERLGLDKSRHLRVSAECIIVNVGGSDMNGKVCSPPMPYQSVGGVIVLGGRESRPHGEGRQPLGNTEQNNRMSTGMKFP
jgi:hypothetical protein